MSERTRNEITFYLKDDGSIITEYAYENVEAFASLISCLFLGDLTEGTINYLINQFDLLNEKRAVTLMNELSVKYFKNNHDEPLIKPSQYK